MHYNGPMGRRGLRFVIALLSMPPAFHAQPQAAGSFDNFAARARAALEAERLDEAIDLFGRATKLRPGWSEGWWHMGTILYDRQRFADARDAFTHFTAGEPKAGPGFAMIGLCEFQLKRYPQALAALEHGLQLGLGTNREFARSALFRDATLHSLLGRPELALKRLTLLMNQDAEAHPGAASQALLGDEQVIDALGIAALRMARLPSDIPSDKTALVRQAGRAQAMCALVDWVAAGEEFRLLIADFGGAPGVHYMYGVFLLKEHPAEAVLEFQKEISISPGDVDARVQIAFTDLATGEYARGRKYAAEAVKLAPANFAAHIAYGRLLLESDDVEQALAEGQTAVKLAADSPDAHLVLSRCYARSNRPQDAERERREFERLRAAMDRAEQVPPAH